jgi:hypothetical protein
MKQNRSKNGSSSPFAHFTELARKLVNVPKKEVDQKEAAYQRKKARKKRRSA